MADEQYEMKSTIHDLEQFTRSLVWKDLYALAKLRLELVKDQLLMADSEKEMYKLQGEAFGISVFCEMPDIMLKRHQEAAAKVEEGKNDE